MPGERIAFRLQTDAAALHRRLVRPCPGAWYRNTAEEDAPETSLADAEARREAHLADKERRRRLQRIEQAIKALDKERGEILKFYFENPTEYAPDKRTRLGELDEELARLEKEGFRIQEEEGKSAP